MTPERVVIINDAGMAKGGATSLALRSARLLAERGVSVTYICGTSGGAPSLAGLEIEVLSLGAARLLDSGRGTALRQGLWNVAARRLIADWVALNDTPGTLYHVHGWAQVLSPAVFAALTPVAARTVIHAHDRFLACPNGAYFDFGARRGCDRHPLSRACLMASCDKRSLAHKQWRVVRQVALRRAFNQRHPWAVIVLIHPDMAPLMEQAGYPADRLHVLRNPAEPYLAARHPAEKGRGIAYIGRVVVDKGVDLLARASVKANMPLTIIGEGSDEALVRRLNPGAQIAGWCKRDDFAQHLTGVRVVVMPSLIPEPFGLVAAEASASGLPVVLSDNALLAPEVAALGLGWSFASGDASALQTCLEKVRDLPSADLRDMSLRGYERADGLSLTNAGWAEGLCGLYDNVLS